jgi:chromosome segregation ATPase
MNHKSIFDRKSLSRNEELYYENINIYFKEKKRNQCVLSEYDQLTMALIQRYTTELSTHAATSRQIQDETQSVEHVLHDVATIKRQDEDEKRYLHSLNDRLEELIRSLDELEIANLKLRDDLNLLITSWGIGGENRARFLQELDEIIHRLSEQNRRKVVLQAEAKLFDELTQVTDRVSVVFIDVINLYRDKCQIIFELTNELEDELRKIRLRLDISNAQVKSHDDDYQNELAKFRSYLTEWSQLALDKQYLLNEIQSLRERYNLRLAYNQEEINEWQRLLNRISQESKNYYRDYLDTIKQQIQMDYEQMAKDQQMEVEIQLKSRLKEIQEKIDLGLPLDENGEIENLIVF